MRIAVTGSTGLIGTPLTAALRQRGDEIIPLVRRPPAPGEIGWDPERGTIDRAGLDGMDAVIHLAGENVFGRWTADKKRRIRDSRVNGTRLLVDALAGLQRKPGTLLSSSAIGYYGDRGEEPVTEDSAPGADFLAQVSRDWEAATAPAAGAGIRVVNMRTGVVLTPTGGALAKMLPPFRLGLGGHVGSGDQYVSWIEMGDIIRAILYLLDNAHEVGPVNLTAPTPVTNRELAKTLGKVLGRPAVVPVPSFALRLAFGGEGAEMLQSGQRVLPARLRSAGFQFAFETVEPALRSVLDAPA